MVPRDILVDVGDLISQLSPIISWGGLASVQPLLNVGGFDINSPIRGLAVESEATSSVPLSASDQALFDQIQRNLQTSKSADPR